MDIATLMLPIVRLGIMAAVSITMIISLAHATNADSSVESRCACWLLFWSTFFMFIGFVVFVFTYSSRIKL